MIGNNKKLGNFKVYIIKNRNEIIHIAKQIEIYNNNINYILGNRVTTCNLKIIYEINDLNWNIAIKEYLEKGKKAYLDYCNNLYNEISNLY